MRTLALGMVATLGLTLGPTAATAAPVSPSSAPAAAHARKATFPALVVRRKVTGLDHPWDVRPIGGGRLIFTQRDRARVSIWSHGTARPVRGFPSRSVWVSGETGLLGLDTDPGFARNHRFYTCQGGTTA